MAITKKQLKNLKPIRKGEVRNPEGGRAQNRILDNLKTLTKEELGKIGSAIIKGRVDEVRALLDDPKTPALQAGVAKVILNVVDKGDTVALNCLLDRLIGKVKEEIEHSGEIGATTRVLLLPLKEIHPNERELRGIEAPAGTPELLPSKSS